MSFESRLRKETAEWIARGIISPVQAEQIQRGTGDEPEKAASRFLVILGSIGALFCTVGLVLIVSANWATVHPWLKIGGLIGLMIAAYGAGWHWKCRRGNLPTLGDVLLALGCVLFLLGVVLVAQTFQLYPGLGNLALIGIAGIAPIPFLTRSRSAYGVLLIAVYLWLIAETFFYKGRFTGAGSGEFTGLLILVCASFAFYWLGFLWREEWSGLARVQEGLAVLVVSGAVYVTGFAHTRWWERQHGSVTTAVYFFAAPAAIAGVVAAFRKWHEWRKLSPWLLLAAIPTAVALANLGGRDVRNAASLLSWVTLTVLGVFMARAGLSQKSAWLVNLGLGAIALSVFTRFFNVFGTKLNQGLVFLFSGVVVLGFGWFFERKRRRLLRIMHAEGQP